MSLLLQGLALFQLPEAEPGFIQGICRWLQETAWATAFRESQYVYPIVEGAHVLALGVSVGGILWFDLRLSGLSMRRHPVSEIFRSVRPWMFTGFAIMIITGLILFLGHAELCYRSGYFRAKVVLLFLALFNVIIFHSTIDRRRASWDMDTVPPLQARIAGIMSMILWTGTIAVGRLMAYNLTG
ncbi:MAG TPA: DUF6644 family protein [Terriglobia bacterium]|nr:DUF6644 family protein [Terriglobia bacterium]